MLDARDLPVSCTNPRALEHYERALLSFQNYFGDPLEPIDQALAEQPDFILAHLFKAAAMHLSSERTAQADARASLAQAQACSPHAHPRELAHLQALTLLVEGRWHVALQHIDQILQTYPQDIFMLQVAHLIDFFRGDALNLRNRPARVLDDWEQTCPGYSFVLGMHAFGLEESNQYRDAEATAGEALRLNRKDPWSIHATIHVMEMQGRSSEGIAFLRARQDDWAPDNGFAFHNWWHLGLLHLEAEEDEQVKDLLVTQIFDPDVDASLALLDATAMLWRLHLLGYRFEELGATIARMWAAKTANEGGFYAFNDFHAALAFATADAPEEIDRLIGQTGQADIPEFNRSMHDDIGLPLLHAIRAYARGEFSTAIDLILPVRDRAYRFGGSHAQRDIINLTLLACAIKAGQAGLTRHLLNERRTNKPDGRLGERLLQIA
ncbi:MAG: tetratricopeptide repeat protein [Pseudomonadota bacterium]